MSGKMPWFRFHWTTLNYHKILNVAAEADEEPILVLGVWTGLLCIAARGDPGPEGGRLLVTQGRPATRAVLARELGMERDRFANLLMLLVDYGSIEYDGDAWQIKNWGSYQMKSDNSTQRVQAWRRKQKEQRGNPGPAPEPPVGADDDTVTDLMRFFTDETSIYPPAMGDIDRWTNDWYRPTSDLLGLANGDLAAAKQTMKAVLALMQKKRLKYTRPGSLTNVTRRYLADKAWDLVQDEAKRIGASGEPELGEELAQAIERAGGWTWICTADRERAAERFEGAYLRGLRK